MHIEIKKTGDKTICSGNSSWRGNGFFVATVGEKAAGYLSGRIFSLQELACCSPVSIVNVEWFSKYQRGNGNREALKCMESDIRALAKSCEKKQLVVLSEAEDRYAANQCCELASGVGEDGFSMLITHRKIRRYPYFRRIRKAFDHIIFLPDDATYTAEILRWIVCGFEIPGYIGVDFEDAQCILTKSAESDCRKMWYKDRATMKKTLGAFLEQVHMNAPKDEAINRLIGVWVPRGFSLVDIEQLYDEIREVTRGELVISCLPNENNDDESWTVALLSAVSKMLDNE